MSAAHSPAATAATSRLRWTACFRRIGGVWLVVHDHASVPAHLESGQAAVDLRNRKLPEPRSWYDGGRHDNGLYAAMMVTKAGGPEALTCVELPIGEPRAGQLRVRVRAAGVGSTDLMLLAGKYRYAPKIPFVPGYEIAGVVDAIGPGVNGFSVGQRVAALTVYGGFGEMIVREAEHFLPIPDGVSDPGRRRDLELRDRLADIHRVAKAKAGQTALVTGAAGGVGTAALQLLRLAGVKTYGAASAKKHATVRKLGAIPIDYRAGRLDRWCASSSRAASTACSTGSVAPTSARASARRGAAGWSSPTGSWRHGHSRHAADVRQHLRRRAPAGTAGSFYGITMLYRKNPKPLREDLPKIFALIAEKKIDPMVSETLPLLEAKRAMEMLAAGAVEGKIVLSSV